MRMLLILLSTALVFGQGPYTSRLHNRNRFPVINGVGPTVIYLAPNAASTALADLSGNGINLTATGSPTVGSTGITCPTASDYMMSAATATLPVVGPWTVYETGKPASAANLWSFADSGTTNNYTIGGETSGNGTATTRSGATSNTTAGITRSSTSFATVINKSDNITVSTAPGYQYWASSGSSGFSTAAQVTTITGTARMGICVLASSSPAGSGTGYIFSALALYKTFATSDYDWLAWKASHAMVKRANGNQVGVAIL